VAQAEAMDETTTPVQADLQDQAPPEELVEAVVFPDNHQMAVALATPGLREQALLDLAVVSNLLNQQADNPEAEVDHTVLAQKFLDDRSWLQMLVDRYGWVRPHGPVLDPAAWQVLVKVQQQGFEGTELVSPGRHPGHVLLNQVFQRSGQGLAVANLPILLLEVEADAIASWDAFIRMVDVEGTPDKAWKVVEETWFKDQQVPALESESDDPEPKTTELTIPDGLTRLMLSTIEARPPDGRELHQLRYLLLTSVMPPEEAESAAGQGNSGDMLYLLSLLDGLHEGRYFEFIRGVLSITSKLLETPEIEADSFRLTDWLVNELPTISAFYAADFARVDPRLNTVMTETHEVLQSIAASRAIHTEAHTDVEAGESAEIAQQDDETMDVRPVSHIKASRVVLADAVAQLALMIPDMGYYFETPVRARIGREVDLCINLAASVDEGGNPVMTRRQFNSCMEKFLQLAGSEASSSELSGDMNGPFTTDTLRRELSVTPWQRINYGIGYLHERYATSCQPPADVLPNPLEWSVLATTMTWFAESFPGFFNTPENETRLERMRNLGEQLALSLEEQTSCLAAGTGLNDLVSRTMIDYELALREFNRGIALAETDFRAQQLSPGADVSLQSDASQKTSYRPDDMLIEPCDKQAVCEMSGSLSTTRALIGLFGDEYLLADQTGMGQIQICYRNMEWVERRSELVRADDENVSNYFGKLGFDLVGRYVENGQASDIFGFRFTSPQEHHYLFAATSEEVLNDSCPVEWVGSRVVTPLRESRGGIVPNRLTYLAAARSVPSRLLQNNWDRGTEWRDWFVTGIGVSALELGPRPEIKTRLNQHLQSLYQKEQNEIYQRVLLPNARNSQGDDVSLFDEMSEVSIAKYLMRMQVMLFYPNSLQNLDSVRTAITGNAGLLESRTFRRFREENTPLTSIDNISIDRLNKFREVWSKQPGAVRRQGSITPDLMHTLTRVNFLYRRFFIYQPEPLQEAEAVEQTTELNQPDV
jgi:hypothetical protein